MAFRQSPRQAALKKKRKRRAAEVAKMRGSRLKLSDIDYKDVATLQRMTTAQGKLFSRKRSGLDATCQRSLSLAVKRARFLALMPYVS
jgi:small subunit ribosomal protein S18